MINIRAVKVLLLLSIVFVFAPFTSHAKVLPKFLFEKALQESKNGDFIQAEKDWSFYLNDNPDDSAALSNRGNIKLALGDTQGAILDQSKAIDLLPLEIDPHINRGIAEESLKKWNAAKADYQWVLEKEPENSSALYNLVNVMGSEGNWLEAKSLFNKASIANSDLTMARSSKALACYQLNQMRQIILYFLRLILYPHIFLQEQLSVQTNENPLSLRFLPNSLFQ